MPKLNISQAARQFEKDRSTIQRHIKDGKLSCEVDSNGHKRIDLAELIRVYGEPEHAAAVAAVLHTEAIPQCATPDTAAFFEEKISLLEQQIEVLRKEKEQERGEYKRREEILQAEKEKLWNQLEVHTRLLEDKREKPQEKQPSRLSQWGRLGLIGLNTVLVIMVLVLFMQLLGGDGWLPLPINQ